MRYANLHTHTLFSDGRHTMRENIESALEKQMLSLGFSDHSFTACDPSYCMHTHQYGEYLSQLETLKQEYADRIPIYAGMELDYYSELPAGDYDYIIASVHYIIRNGVTYPIDHSPRQQEECIRDAFGGNVLDMAKCYYDMLTEHVIRVRPTFVGHFDVITKFSLMPEEEEAYRQIAGSALKEVLKHCPYVEMNTGGISRGWRKTPYPGPYLLDTLKENGGEILLGADSHDKNNLIFHFDECVELLRENGFDHISVFRGDGFDKMAI